MTQTELIKAEIKRLIKQTELRRGEASADGARETLYWLKDFIESLEKEPKNDGIMSQINNLPVFDGKITAKGLRELGDKIALARKNGSWEGVDVDKFMDEVRGRNPKIKGWVARDENGDLYAFVKKPERCLGEFELKDKTLWEDFTGNGSIRLPKEDFPDLKWEDEPIEIELTIRKICKD